MVVLVQRYTRSRESGTHDDSQRAMTATCTSASLILKPAEIADFSHERMKPKNHIRSSYRSHRLYNWPFGLGRAKSKSKLPTHATREHILQNETPCNHRLSMLGM